ncbi:hypothetical protein IWW50_006024 [Coemansia erecta]|nr:hypothetical protein GGF43_005625 [Coemansia sp. RSA 2618]KAJ2817845.1 hypothetical protein IWW50_006024 [Coemansia erecta]
MKLAGVIGFLALGVAASPTNIKNRIVPRNTEDVARIIGGEVAGSNEFLSTAYLEMYDGGTTRNRCTGSLIAPNVVVTAGHCIYKSEYIKYTASQFQVGITHTIPTSSSVLFEGYSVSKVIIHPKFTMQYLEDDVAVLILSQSVPASEGTPIKIYSGSYSTKTPIRAAGFGLTDPLDQTSISGQLMAVDLAIGGRSICENNSDTYDPKTQICTDGTAGKDTCQGDSGGPLVTPVDSGSQKTALLALTSYGTQSMSNPEGLCAVKGSSGFYTYLAPFIDWIAEQANLDASDIQITNKTSSSSSGSSGDDNNDTTDKDDSTKTATNDGDFVFDSDAFVFDSDAFHNSIQGILGDDNTKLGNDNDNTKSGASSATLALAAVGVAALFF